MGGEEQLYCFSPDNCQQKVMCMPVHYHVVTPKSVSSTELASSCKLLPSYALNFPIILIVTA